MHLPGGGAWVFVFKTYKNIRNFEKCRILDHNTCQNTDIEIKYKVDLCIKIADKHIEKGKMYEYFINRWQCQFDK